MSTALLIALIVVAVLACPLMSRLQVRRGRAADCCASPSAPSDQNATQELEMLKRHSDELAARIAELERSGGVG